MPSPATSLSDPTSLKCAACGCHRNFHLRVSVTDDSAAASTYLLDFNCHHPRLLRRAPSPSPPPPPSNTNYSPAPHQMLLALSSAALDDQPVAKPLTPTKAKAENSGGRKRIRTKFSQEQKEKILSFSEKFGWKMRKGDASVVEEFCNEIGAAKGVLKVWMHNNKNSFGKRELNNSMSTAITNQ